MIRNANEFLNELRNARFRYTESYAPRISEIRRRYAGLLGDGVPGLLQEALEETLEIHERIYYVNALLQALNWRLDSSMEDGLPSLLPEVPIRSARKGTVRFLDYLGMEHQDDKPLLIVETKRPSEALPRLRMPRPGDELKSSSRRCFATACKEQSCWETGMSGWTLCAIMCDHYTRCLGTIPGK